VVLAIGVTVFIFLAMTLFAFCSKTDFTGFGPYLFAALLVLIFMSTICLMMSFFIQVKWLYMAYNALGVLIFTLYIVYDTQLILGEWGGHQVQFNIDDYVLAAMTLYLDIINLFLHLLALFGSGRRS